MKKFYFLAIALSMALCGCTGGGNVDEPNNQPSKSKVTLINAVIDPLELTDPSPVWGTGDKVAVTDLTTLTEFKLKQGTGTTAAEFTGILPHRQRLCML